MAYGLKYTTYITDKANTRISLNIYQDGWAGTSYEIGAPRNLSLDVQGSQGEVFSPIVKTSVSFSMIDAFDMGSTQADGTTCVQDGKKWGQWEEFFTNDVTKYKLVVKQGSTTIWTGFLTPDSWGEDMQYRGAITIVARDMLGYLDELEFDLTGTTTISNLISTAFTRSKGAMGFTQRSGEMLYNKSNSQSILSHTIGCETFNGKTWYKALEETLESLGLVIRYNGQNGFDVTSLRYLTQHARGTQTPTFINRSGHRTLDPAVKQLIETFEAKFEDYTPNSLTLAELTNTGDPTYKSYTEWDYMQGTTRVHGSAIVQLTRAVSSRATGWTGSCFVRRGSTTYSGEDVPKLVDMYFPASMREGETDCESYWNELIDDNIRGAFGLTWQQVAPTLSYTSPSDPSMRARANINVGWVKTRFKATYNGSTYWYAGDGGWTTTYTDDTCIFKIAPDSVFSVPSLHDVAVTVQQGQIYCEGGSQGANGLLVPIVPTFTLSGVIDAPTEQKTTTIYNAANHKEITRSPQIGSIGINAPQIIATNLLSYGGVVAPNSWNWGSESAGYPLSVMIQAQLLVLYASQNGNSIFTGSAIVPAGASSSRYASMPLPAYKYTYFSRNCILTSGTFDFNNCCIESATMRECLEWSDVWTTFAPEYTKTESYGKGSTSKTSGGGGGGGGTGGSGLTSVGLTVPTGLQIANSPLTANGVMEITYAQGYSLPTTAKQTEWDEAADAVEDKVDKVPGKGLSTNDYTTTEKTKLAGLENYDDTDIYTALAGKVDKVSGKGLSTNDYTTAEKTKLAGLQDYSTEIEALEDAVDDLETGKVDKETGKGLSTEDYTTAEKNKLAGLNNYDQEISDLEAAVAGLANAVKHDGASNAVHTIVVCTSYPTSLNNNTLYILI